jgi:hypothetical protein
MAQGAGLIGPRRVQDCGEERLALERRVQIFGFEDGHGRPA